MGYITVEDFTAGLDTRRSAETSKPGILSVCKNAHITRGGEIEQNKAFVEKYTGLTDTFGMHGTDNKIYVFGSIAPPTLPPGIVYQQLVHKDGITAMSKLLDTENFNGKVFALAKFIDGYIFAYYDGVRVADWDTRAAVFADVNTLAKQLGALVDKNDACEVTVSGNVLTIISTTKGVAITVFASTGDGGGNPDQTIALVETVPNSPTTYNTYVATIGGTYESDDQFSITVNGTAYVLRAISSGMPNIALTFGQKEYTTVGSLLNFSAIDHPELVTSGTGYGFINIANHSAGSEILTALEIYQNLMAIFSRNVIQLWFMDPDPASNARQQTIRNSGARASKSVISFGDTDVFYLHDTGVRSLRSRAGYSAAFVSDVGTAIDTYLQEYLATLSESAVDDAVAIMEQQDGRYWLAIQGKVFIFSYFPTSKISAWSEYNRDYVISDMLAIGQKTYIRSGDTIYKYGGDTNQEYDDDDIVEVQLSFMTAGKLATDKVINGIDCAAQGEWNVEMLVNPADLTQSIPIGKISGSTFIGGMVTLPGETTHFAPKFTSTGTGKHMLKKVTVHFDFGEEN